MNSDRCSLCGIDPDAMVMSCTSAACPIWGKPAPKARPVQLQLNNSGSWKKVATWDAGDDEASRMAHDAVALLGAINPGFTWRIATDEGYPIVLKRWESKSGWSVA